MRNRMPRFFFDLMHDDQLVTRDHQGTDLPDQEAAEMEAVATWRRIIRERAAGGTDPIHWHVVVLDEAGGVLAKLPYPDDPED